MTANSQRDLVADREHLEQLLNRYGRLYRLKPRRLGAKLVNFIPDRRRVVDTDMGVRLYVDPFTHLGIRIVRDRIYEPETYDLICANLGLGDAFIDVGANEGVFSAVAASRVGPEGTVVAIEPQTSLRSLIEINLKLNDAQKWRIYTAGLGRLGEAQATLYLYSSINSGMASIGHRYFSTVRSEPVRLIPMEKVVSDMALDHINLMKVDVEGYEDAVVEGLMPLLREGRVHALLLDFHTAILRKRGTSAEIIHEAVVSSGMVPAHGTISDAPTSYVLYRH